MTTKCMLATMILAACAADAPAPSLDEAAPGDTPSGGDEAVAGTAEQAATTEEPSTPVALRELARVRLFSGELVFADAADGSGIVFDEAPITASTGAVSGVLRNLSALDTYLAVTPATAPVPRRMVEVERSADVRQRAALRPQVDALAAPVAGLPQAELTGIVGPLGNVTQWCQGTTSASFLADECSENGWWDVEFCHNGTWSSVTDEVTWSDRKQWSRSTTVACGANGEVRHSYKFGGIWYHPLTTVVPSNAVRRRTHEGNTRLARKIRHRTLAASGFVRGASWFRDFPF